MYKHILIPTDGSDLSEIAVRQGIAFAKSIDARVTAVTVYPPFHTVSVDPFMVTETREHYREDVRTEGERYLGTVEQEAKLAGVPCELLLEESEHPYQAIIDVAARQGCDLIFMASHGRRGMAALVLGSETTKVLTHSKIPVLVCR